MHGHRDMEIVTYVLEGALAHKDSLGNGATILPGDVQRMSAGKGILHSEFNHDLYKPTHLLQIWILPTATGGKPGYEQNTLMSRTSAVVCVWWPHQTARRVCHHRGRCALERGAV